MCVAGCNGTWYMLDEIDIYWEQGRMRDWTQSVVGWTEMERIWRGYEESSSPTPEGLHVLMQTLVRTYYYQKKGKKLLQVMEP